VLSVKLRVTSYGFNLIKSVGDREWGVGKTNKEKGERLEVGGKSKPR